MTIDIVRRDAPIVKVEQVVVVEFRRGAGVVGDPVRIVTAYYSFDGELLAENDPVAFYEETQ